MDISDKLPLTSIGAGLDSGQESEVLRMQIPSVSNITPLEGSAMHSHSLSRQ